jgi:hypothetical protein
VVTTLLAVGAVLAAPAPRAAAWSDGPCPTLSTGVTVVVDFHQLGGGVVVRCAPGAPADGWEALTGAGFAVRGTTRFPGFVCRIDDRPATDPCVTTAPADAYWSYWNAARGSTWTYSEVGARSRTPPVGSVEAWSFSDESGRPPRIPPPQRPATTTTTAPPRPQPPAPPAGPPSGPPSGPAAGAPTGPAPGATGAPAGPADPAPRPGTAEVAGATVVPPADQGSPAPGLVTSTGPAAATSRDGPAGNPPEANPDGDERTAGSLLTDTTAGSGPGGTLAAVGLLAALAASTLVTVRRRRARPEAADA